MNIPGTRVLLPAQQREVKLPEIFEARRGVHRLHHLRLAAFARAVVHDGDARMQRVHQHRRIRAGLPVVQTQQHIHGAEAVVRAHQLEFLVLGEIAQMSGAKFSERDVDADRLRVLGVVVSGLVVRRNMDSACPRRAAAS